MARVDTLTNFLTDVAGAIKTKKGDTTPILASDFDTEIANLPSGGGETPEAPEKDVNFYDYDGKRVYSYTKSEFLALNEYPANPTHQGLTAQGWNWDYQDAVDYVTEYGILDVGQMYITDDGATRITIEISNDTPEARRDVYIQLSLNGIAEINWGDGSSTEELTGTSLSTNVNTHHMFQGGTYVISIKPINNCQIKFSYRDFSKIINCGNTTNIYYLNYMYLSYIKEINIGKNVEIGENALRNITNFKLSMPLNLTNNIGNYGFICAPNIIILPKNLTNFGSTFLGLNSIAPAMNIKTSVILNGGIAYDSFTYGDKIVTSAFQKRFIIPSKLTSIYNGITILPGVLKLVIPKTITNINSLPLGSCKELNFSQHTSIPTLGSSTAFGPYFPSDCQIVVPDALYENWIVATNWSNYASQIIKKSDFDNQ